MSDDALLDDQCFSELYANLCNVVERNYLNLPLPGAPGDDGLCHTSTEARAAAWAILEVLFNDAEKWEAQGQPGREKE